MPINDNIRKSLDHLLATEDMDKITPGDVVYTFFEQHDAVIGYGFYPLPGIVQVTRADGKDLYCILHCETETGEPAGWTTAYGSSVEDLQPEDGGESDDPEQVIRDLHAAVIAWLDQCDMSDN